MLLLNPRRVIFGNHEWDNVGAVAIDRATSRAVLEWSDSGPHPVLADSPEQKTTVTVTMDLQRDDLASPRPGDTGVLALDTSPTGADLPRRRYTMTCVVTDVSHELSLRKGAVRTIRLVALSPDGATDPISAIDLGGVL